MSVSIQYSVLSKTIPVSILFTATCYCHLRQHIFISRKLPYQLILPYSGFSFFLYITRRFLRNTPIPNYPFIIFLQFNFFFFKISGTNRLKMGLPAHWPTINRWLAPGRPVYKPPPRPPAPIKKRCPDIPALSSYKTTPSSLFWSLFPHRPLPTVPGTPVNVPILTNMLNTVRSELLASQISRGEKLIAELTHGVDALQMQYLPGAIIPNSGSVFTHGEVFTDVLAFWIRQGFVAGPFPAPPCPDFRANSMMAVKQKAKYVLS
jgi:hypothetical protein